MGIIESVQQYDLNIPAGGAQNIDVAGDRIQFLSAIDPFAQIEVRPNFAQGNISLRPGQGFRFSEQVTRWVVFNRGSVPLSGYLLIGSGDFFDQRIAGTVDVIDGGKARTMGGIAMMAYGVVSGAAAKFSRVQLWNPAGSGKRICLETVIGNTGATPTFSYAQFMTTPLGTLIQNGMSKQAGGAPSVAEIRVDTTSTSAVWPGTLVAISLPASSSLPQRFAEPVIIMPGYGMVMYATTINADLGASFEWYEDAI
ncbi:hypothetical protein [Cupriavidus pauculus]|uniref:hypothetical protein n=1 Tax=Cupriavidus pauculus TaxID=82633 RepID=UPI0038575648